MIVCVNKYVPLPIAAVVLQTWLQMQRLIKDRLI